MGDHGLIEDLMVQVVAQRFGQMKKKDVASVMGKEGQGDKGSKILGQVGVRLQIKKEPGAEPDKSHSYSHSPSRRGHFNTLPHSGR